MLKNERGSTLITVLLMVVVFTVIGLSLVGLNVSNAKQGTQTKNNLQATNLAEMGTTQLKEMVYAKLADPTYTSMSLTDIQTNLQSYLNTNINTDYKVYNTMSSPKFRINSATVTSWIEGTNEVINVAFNSMGTSSNNQTKNVTGSIQLKRTKAFPAPPSGATVFSTDQSVSSNTDQSFQTVYYSDDLAMASNTNILVSKDLYAQGTITQSSNSDLIVNGNAYVTILDPKTNNNPGNLSLMCVDQTLYVYTPDTTARISYTQLPFSNRKGTYQNCHDVQIANPAFNGIFAKNVQYISSIPEPWNRNKLTMENIQYP